MNSVLRLDKRLVAGYNEFGFRLLTRLAAHAPGTNIFFSPASICLALAMTANGASGETREEMLAVLSAAGIGIEGLNEANAALLPGLSSLDESIKLAIANSLWVSKRAPLKPEFVSRNRQDYRAEIANVDLSDKATCGRINEWVREQTNGKIDQLVKPLDCSADTLLMLLNAIYFKGAWSEPFTPSQTRPGPFLLAGGRRKQVQMMNRSGHYPYLKDGSLQAISIPYGDGTVALEILLPATDQALAEVSGKLDAARWEKSVSGLKETGLDLGLPRLKLEYEQELNEPLQELGMKQAFTPHADFSGMSDEQAAISVVRHKSFIDVNEEGTEAAAATAVVMLRTASFFAKPEMRVDRPFLLAIRHRPSKLVLFLGLVHDPG